MKYIEVDEELYRLIASKTEQIGESASEILRRLLGLEVNPVGQELPQAHSEPIAVPQTISEPSIESAPVTHASLSCSPLPSFAMTSFDEHQLAAQKNGVGRFLFILETVYLAAPDRFSQVLNIKGRDRLYFAKSKQSLLAASKTANPKEIGQSGFWVTTNNSSAKKRAILNEVLQQYDTHESQIEAIILSI